VTGEGRKKLACPFGCGEDLSDTTVRNAISQYHWHWSVSVWNTYYYVTLGPLFYFCWYHYCRCRHPDLLEERMERVWFRLTKTLEEVRDLKLYERWSLTTALSQLNQEEHGNDSDSAGDDTNNDNDGNRSNKKKGKKNENSNADANRVYTHVQHCPRPNCECLWLINTPYHHRKLENERTYNHKQRPEEAPKGFTKSLIMSASSWLFFKPLDAEVEEQIMDRNGFTTLHWMNANDIDIFRKARIAANGTGDSIGTGTGNGNGIHTGGRIRSAIATMTQQDSNDSRGIAKDGRRVTCPGCEYHFCALCSRPWSTISKHNTARIVKHTGRLCAVYAKKVLDDDDYIDMADCGDARCCPGCSMRTNRTDGCNHMTCPCGYQWCYVCGSRWNSSHYSCADGNHVQMRGDGGCSIS